MKDDKRAVGRTGTPTHWFVQDAISIPNVGRTSECPRRRNTGPVESPPHCQSGQSSGQCKYCNSLHSNKTGQFCSSNCQALQATYDARLQRSSLRAAYEDGDHTAFIQAVRSRVTITESDCWQWTGRVSDGYPSIRMGRKHYAVHRLVLEAKHGAALGSQAAHHQCANSVCVNPDHLQPVTHAENIAEMLSRHSYLERIAELEAALAMAQPNHPLLAVIEVA